MKTLCTFLLLALTACSTLGPQGSRPVRLADGKTFNGWEGDTRKTWRIQEGAFVGGTISQMIPNNEFLATTRSYTNFILKLKVKLEGTEGFVNGGIQIRSERVKNPAFEMTGYQADVGMGWWGSLYDESRRNKILVKADPDVIQRILKPTDWNDYEIRCEGPRIQLFLNGAKTVDYTETDPSIPLHGKIAVQIHGGAKALAHYKDIWIQELP